MDWREHGTKAPNRPSKRPMRKGGGSPTFCWHCFKQLQLAAGKGLFFYHIIKDVDNREHRVHGACLDEVLKDRGNSWVKP